mmetsp:Transcript_47366/g.135873  ORF Transcript_47366/g.135873 Transcript_47366/m.135873 type:complete len:255 (+) Transcript_47366:239-1003(+)
MITNRSTSAVAPAMAEPIQAAARATNGGIEVSPRACMKPKLGLSLSDMLTLLISGGTVGAGRDLSMASCRKAAGEERSAPGGSPALPPAPAVAPTCAKLRGASVVGVAVLASNSAPGGGSGRHWYTSRALMDQNACFSSSGWYWMRSAHDILDARSGQLFWKCDSARSPPRSSEKTMRIFWKWLVGHAQSSKLKNEYGLPQPSGSGIFATMSRGSVPSGQNQVRMRLPMGSHSPAQVPPPAVLSSSPMEPGGPS